MSNSIVFNEDCMAVMARYPDKYFDLAVVDPPYFKGPEKRLYYGSKYSKSKIKRGNYQPIEQWAPPNCSYFNELIRVSKHQIVWGCNYYKFIFGPGRIIWDKVSYDSTFSDAEEAYCSLHDSVRLFRYMWNGALQGKSMSDGHIVQGNKKEKEKRIHPTQKPVKLYDWIFKNYAKEGQRILDTHLGSGSSRIAAHRAGLDFVGCELDTQYFKAAEKRFKEHTAQLRMF